MNKISDSLSKYFKKSDDDTIIECPNCGSQNVVDRGDYYYCRSCGNEW